MEKIQLPPSSFTFRASALAPNDQWKIDCFPLAGAAVFCADQLGRAFGFDAQQCLAGTMPSLHKPKRTPISLFVRKPDADTDYDHDVGGTSLFVMERIPAPKAGCSAQHSDQFEAFVYRKTTAVSFIKSWHCHLLPPPPYVREPKYRHGCPEITSYAVVGGGSHVCISVEGVGTYCLDTANHTWSEVGEWTLPFHGKVEYVPELKLWFGFSAEAGHLAAVDLSAMDSQPQLVGDWKELDLPEERKECKDSQLVNLGSSRFCIARFFRARTLDDDDLGDEFTVLTGVEVVPRIQNANGGIGKVELRMIPHKSKRVDGTTVEALF